MKIALVAAMLLMPITAHASTWTESDYDRIETPLTAEDRELYKIARQCGQPDEKLGTFYMNEDAFAFFRTTPSGTTYRLWGPAAERADLDRCNP